MERKHERRETSPDLLSKETQETINQNLKLSHEKDERLNFSDRTPSVRRLVVSLVLMLLAALPAAAQNKKITVDLDNVPVREFIKTVESQSGYTFAYNNPKSTSRAA